MPYEPITHRARDGRDREIMTVGQLRHILAQVDPNTHVVTADDDGAWWTNISEVVMPDGDGVVAVTLIPGDPFDPRQT